MTPQPGDPLTALVRATPGLRTHLIARSAHEADTAALLRGAAHAAGPVRTDAALQAHVRTLTAQVVATYGRRPDDQARAAQDALTAPDLSGRALDDLLGRVSLNRALIADLSDHDPWSPHWSGPALVTGYALALGAPPSRANLTRIALTATPDALRRSRAQVARTLDADAAPLPHWGDATQYPGRTSGVMCDHPCPLSAGCLLHAASGTQPRADTRYPGFAHDRNGCGHFLPERYRGAAVTTPDSTPTRAAGRPRRSGAH